MTDMKHTEKTRPDKRIAPGIEPGGSTKGKGTPPSQKHRASKKLIFTSGFAVLVILCVTLVGVGSATGLWGGPSDALTTTQGESDNAEKSSSAEAESGSEGSAANDIKSYSDETVASGVPSNQQSEQAPQPANPNMGPSNNTSNNSAAPSSDQGSGTSGSVAPATMTVSVAIDASRGGGSNVAKTVTLDQGATVYDALIAAGAKVGGSPSYVTSINGLAERAKGGGSGWLYFVNGVSPGIGGCFYSLQGGESVRWVYSLDMGNDL